MATSYAGLLEEFAWYLREVKGLSRSSEECYARWAELFLSEVTATCNSTMSSLEPWIVRDYVTGLSDRFSPATVKLIATSLRALLRFAFISGQIDKDLVQAVGVVVTRRAGKIPKALESTELERLLGSPDRSAHSGVRDYAVLLFLARLGLRAGEVAALELDDFRWREGSVNARVKGGGRTVLPLPRELADAAIDYLQIRPACPFRAVFVTLRGEIRPLTRGAVTQVVARHAQRVGLGVVHAHRLRHTLAREILDNGGSIAEVSQLLGHGDVQTTMMYSSFDLDSLRPLARPWPVTS